jgi:hypothetical protein
VSVQRIRVSGRDEQLVVALGALAGVGLALQGLSPTGATVIDWVVLVLSCSFAVWAGSSAPWWALSITAAGAAALAAPIAPLVLGIGVLLLSLAVGLKQRSQPVVRAAILGAAIAVLGMARDLDWFGLTTLIGVSLVTFAAVMGLTRRSSRGRRLAVVLAGAAGAVVVLGVIGLVIAGTSARPDLTEGNRSARDGLDLIEQGEFDAARTSFQRAADAFERADGDLGSVLTQPARLVPVVSQHRNAGAELAGAAAEATSAIEQQLAAIDLDRLRIVDGRIDIEAVRELRAPMNELQLALDELELAVFDASSPWLVGPLQDELDELTAQIDEQQDLGAKVDDALEVAPAILGADGPRVYFVMFTTPAEARGTGGFMGNYAEVTVDGGRIAMTGFGRHSDLNAAAGGEFELHDPPPDWLARYGSEGFAVGEDRRVVRDAWSVINLSPHFPYTAEVIADLYPQSGGQTLDGVFSLDVYALEALIGLVGPIELDDGTVLDGTNAAQYLLVDQYEFEDPDDNAQRIDQLEVVAEEVVTRLLTTAPPDPLDFGQALAPMARQRRLLGSFGRAAEDAVVDAASSMDGRLLDDLDGRDGISIVAVNDAGNKLDTYLGRTMTLTSTPDGDQLDVTVSHDAPVDQLPPYVIGRTQGQPDGWARVWLTVNTNRLLSSATLDGVPVELSSTEEANVNNYGVFLELEPGTSQTLSLQLAGPTSADGLVIDPQPLVRPERWTVDGRDLGELRERTVARSATSADD